MVLRKNKIFHADAENKSNHSNKTKSNSFYINVIRNLFLASFNFIGLHHHHYHYHQHPLLCVTLIVFYSGDGQLNLCCMLDDFFFCSLSLCAHLQIDLHLRIEMKRFRYIANILSRTCIILVLFLANLSKLWRHKLPLLQTHIAHTMQAHNVRRLNANMLANDQQCTAASTTF